MKLTAGNVHDSQILEDILTGSEEEAYGDGAYAGKTIAKMLEARNIKNRINQRTYRNKPLAQDDEEYNHYN